MFATAPSFWWQSHADWRARLLTPFGLVYGTLASRRMRRTGIAPAVPVLCIGNFTAGGAGKTPTAIEIAQRLQDRCERPAFLSRGHGRTLSNVAVIAVDAVRHVAKEVGDEPLLLARHAPTFVAVDRVKGAEAAFAEGATILIMDDGLQNPALRKTASVVVADGATGIGNGRCLPAGPLRAPLERQWTATSLLCVIGPGAPGEALAREARQRGIPVARARLDPDPLVRASLQGRRLYAFSGIGRPEKFFHTLEACGLEVVGRRAFPDHHAFTAEEQRGLLRDAEHAGAELVTTEKDRVRLPPEFATHVLPVRLVFEDGAGAIDALLDSVTREGLSRP